MHRSATEPEISSLRVTPLRTSLAQAYDQSHVVSARAHTPSERFYGTAEEMAPRPKTAVPTSSPSERKNTHGTRPSARHVGFFFFILFFSVLFLILQSVRSLTLLFFLSLPVFACLDSMLLPLAICLSHYRRKRLKIVFIDLYVPSGFVLHLSQLASTMPFELKFWSYFYCSFLFAFDLLLFFFFFFFSLLLLAWDVCLQHLSEQSSPSSEVNDPNK